MVNEELLIEPMIIHGPGCCPKCGGTLFVADSELTLMELNKEGIPITEETTVRCKAACVDCGYEQRMIRWDGGYIPFSRSSLIMKIMQRKDERRARINELNSKAKTANPFAVD